MITLSKRKTGGEWEGHWKKGKKAEEMEQEKDHTPRRENKKEKRKGQMKKAV